MYKDKEVQNVKNFFVNVTTLTVYKGNNKITELRTILQRESQNSDKISQQPENCENRNDPDLVQAFLKKWWVESDFKNQAVSTALV
jgi:hypothetical protein